MSIINNNIKLTNQVVDTVLANSDNPIANKGVYEYMTNNASLVTTAKSIVSAINENTSAIAGLSGVVSVKVVATLPTTPVEKTIYYIGTAAPYQIKLYVDGAYTDLGTTSVDLSQYVQKTDIVDNLTSIATNKPLSANQGKQLNDSKIGVNLSHSDEAFDVGMESGKVTFYGADHTVEVPNGDNYLAKSGGTMTGQINDATTGDASGFGHPIIKREDNSYTVEVCGGSSVADNAFLRLGGGTHALAGGFRLAARSTASNYKILSGETTGALTWNGNVVPVLKTATFSGTTTGTGAIAIGTIGQDGYNTVPLYAKAQSGYQVGNTDHLILRAGQGYYTAYSQNSGTLQAHINATYKITVYYLEWA